MRSLVLAVSLLLFVLVVMPSTLDAQEVTAGIFGIVQDSSSSVIPAAQIRLKNLDTGRVWQTTSDESGNFSVTLLPIGTYEVSAEAQGFKRTVVNDVALRVNDNRRFLFTMEVGQLAEQVTVEATA